MLALVVFLASLRLGSATVQLFNFTGQFDGWPASCSSVLTQSLDCDESLLWVDASEKFVPDEILTKLCTPNCAHALSTYTRRVAGACGTTKRFIGRDGRSYIPGYYPETVSERFDTICLKDSDGAFCHAKIRDALHIDPDTQKMTAKPDPSVSCLRCQASILSTQLQMQIQGTETDSSSVYSSFTSSCKFSNMVPTPLATTTTYVSAAPKPTPTCAGKSRQVKSGDNCRAVSLSEGINTNQLLVSNALQAWCSNFPSSGSVCIPDAEKCKPHQLNIDGSDSCASLATKYGVTWTQIVTWNPDVGTYCEGINRLAKQGFVLCVSNPGGTWVNPHPELSPTPTTSAPETYFTLTGSAFTAEPSPSGFQYPNMGYIEPYANGTNQNCATYDIMPVYLDTSMQNKTWDCEHVAAAYAVQLDDLMAWNPSLKGGKTVGGRCILPGNYQYCLQLALVESSQMPPSCAQKLLAKPGYDCDTLLKVNGVDKQKFIALNPDVGSSCNIVSGHTYCAATGKSFRPPDTISTCSKWASPDSSVKDMCGALEKSNGLTHGRFVAWNPSVKSDCSGIQPSFEYCVGTPTFPPPST